DFYCQLWDMRSDYPVF
nr:immunoglobulin light chain junction region [Macaca mulatta]